MASDCKECQQNLQARKGRVNFSQLTEEERKVYWQSLRKLAETTPENSIKQSKLDQG